MPELPEVETVRLQLKHKVLGKTIDSGEVFHNKTVGYDETLEDKLIKKTLSDIDRIGKLLIFNFSNETDLFLLAHLKMTGQFLYTDKTGEIHGGGHSLTAADLDLPGRHTRVTFHFTDKTALHFNDMRLFGYTKLATAQEVAEARFKFGPEPISKKFDCEWFSKTFEKEKQQLRQRCLISPLWPA